MQKNTLNTLIIILITTSLLAIINLFTSIQVLTILTTILLTLNAVLTIKVLRNLSSKNLGKKKKNPTQLFAEQFGLKSRDFDKNGIINERGLLKLGINKDKLKEFEALFPGADLK